MERLSATAERGSSDYGDKATANCVSFGAKLVYAPIERFYGFVNPAYSVAVSKDENFKRVSDASDINAGGFMLTAGVIFNF
jgi:hypothetical protein